VTSSTTGSRICYLLGAFEATPSEDETTRLRTLIRRTEEAVDDLSAAEQDASHEATVALRKFRRVQHSACPEPPHRTWIHGWNVTDEHHNDSLDRVPAQGQRHPPATSDQRREHARRSG